MGVELGSEEGRERWRGFEELREDGNEGGRGRGID